VSTDSRVVLSLRGLSYRYPDGTAALKDVSLDLREGERLALMGPNGAGKSTLLLHLNALLDGEGKLEVDGISLSKTTVGAIRQKVGLVFQNPDDQLFCPTVFEDVGFGPRNMGLSDTEVEHRVSGSLKAVGLDGFERRNPAHLSNGEKKRAAIATVHAMRPLVFALDEPTGNLDARGRRGVLELLLGLGGAQIIVTHDLELVRALCSRVLVMEGGRFVAEGPVPDILADPVKLKVWGLA